MITAHEARRESEEANSSRFQNTLEKIENLIIEAAQGGKFKISTDIFIGEEVACHLTHLGYNIESYIRRNESVTTIKW